ncbi:unnamed protein product, partial [Ixodes pacificus]
LLACIALLSVHRASADGAGTPRANAPAAYIGDSYNSRYIYGGYDAGRRGYTDPYYNRDSYYGSSAGRYRPTNTRSPYGYAPPMSSYAGTATYPGYNARSDGRYDGSYGRSYDGRYDGRYGSYGRGYDGRYDARYGSYGRGYDGRYDANYGNYGRGYDGRYGSYGRGYDYSGNRIGRSDASYPGFRSNLLDDRYDSYMGQRGFGQFLGRYARRTANGYSYDYNLPNGHVYGYSGYRR